MKTRSQWVGLATAAYGTGAATYSYVLGPMATQEGSASALVLLAAHLLAASLVAGSLFLPARDRLALGPAVGASESHSEKTMARLWFIYFLGACGGLMAIAHGSSIASQSAASMESTPWASTLIAVGSIGGSVQAGFGWRGSVPARL